MIRVYTIVKNELFAYDIKFQKEMDLVTRRFDRVWVDCWDLDDREARFVARLLGCDPQSLKKVEKGKIKPDYSKCFDDECLFYTNISTPIAEFSKKLIFHPFHFCLKKQFLITLRSAYSTKLIDSTINSFKRLQLEKRKPIILIAKLIQLIIEENSDAMFSIRELIDKIEAEALDSHKKKMVITSIFELKRQLSTFHRILWSERELLSDIILGIIPNLKLAGEAQMIINDSLDDVTRELEFLSSYENSLDSILTLLDLGSIHRVEQVLVYLTWALVTMTIILIALEVSSFF